MLSLVDLVLPPWEIGYVGPVVEEELMEAMVAVGVVLAVGRPGTRPIVLMGRPMLLKMQGNPACRVSLWWHRMDGWMGGCTISGCVHHRKRRD